jgi:protein arginine kinase activator
MLCNACKKNEATVHLTQIVDNKMQTIDLCESCSKAKGVDDPTGFSLAGLLLGLSAGHEQESPAATTEPKCPRCGFSLGDFKKAGRLGCVVCYKTFAEPLQPLLKSMHKGTRHVGKVPHSFQRSHGVSDRLRQLQKELDEAIKTEDFERAAILRDEIKQTREQAGPVSAG